jgi:hypothetical protein
MKLVKVSALVAAVLVSSVFATPVQWTSAAGGNDHWYDVVANLGVTGGSADIGWNAARSNALGSTFMGMNGYLATVTSAAENAFIANLSANAGWAWLGGSDGRIEGQWRWIDGPEAGSLFTYTAWASGEPNNYGVENYVATNWSAPGNWNDLAPNNLDSYGGLTHYVVEYSGTSSNVPEPGSLALVGIALSGLGLASRKK